MGDSAAGPPDAIDFDALVGPWIDDGFRLAYALLLDRGHAEDAVQEAAFKAWRKLHTFRRDGKPRAWFLGIVANQCRSATRRHWWKVIVTDRVNPTAARWPADDAIDLRRALARLPQPQREVVVLRYYFDLPLEEIAAVTGQRPGTVRSRLHRAIAALGRDAALTEDRAAGEVSDGR